MIATPMEVAGHADVVAVLADPRFAVPPLPPADDGATARFRSAVARFSTGAAHRRRRRLVERDLAGLDPAALRTAARDAAAAGAPARRVPVLVLAAALGLPGATPDLVTDLAAAYHPGADADRVRRADAAVDRLLRPGYDEEAANRVGLLVQACDATAGLVDVALGRLPSPLPTDALLAAVLRDEPPVRRTRRAALVDVDLGGGAVPAGTVVSLDLTARGADLAFGAGPRPCPGREHALALAAGVVDAARGAL